MSKLTEKFPDWSEEQLEISRNNTLRYIVEGREGGHSPEKIAEAQAHIDAIHQEFSRRMMLVRKGEYKPALRKEGVLARIGYRVGNQQGVKTPLRRKILELAVTDSIPVTNPLEIDRWGEPSTEKRLKKIVDSLAFFLNENKRFNDDRLAKAIIEWKEDLDWLKETYYEPNNYKFSWPRY